MQVISQELQDALDWNTSLEVYSRAIVEWEVASYYEHEVIVSPSVHPDLFPGEPLSDPRRPVRSGIAHAVTGNARVTDPDTYPRYRVVSEDMNYKYYVSRRLSQEDGTYTTPVGAILLFDETISINKIVAGFEISEVTPTDVRVLVTKDGGDTWINQGVFSGTDVDAAEGTLSIYFSGGTWNTSINVSADELDDINGVWIRVLAVDKPSAPTSIIQLSPRLVMDVSDRIIDASVSGRREDYTLTSPVGVGSSRSANLTLENTDRLFDYQNESSPLYGLLDKNVKVEVFHEFYREDQFGFTSPEVIPQGVFFAESWNIASEATVQLEATDRSKFMQETMIENSFYWNQNAENIVPDIVERFGHPLHDMRYTAEDAGRKIPYVFFKNETSVWDALQSLATAEQASFYFDEHDRFVWESRDYVWQIATPAFTLRNEETAGGIENILSLDTKFEIGANKVKVLYTPLEAAKDHNGDIINQVLWEEQQDTYLWASPMRTASLLKEHGDGVTFRVDPEDQQFMANDGIINLNGEYIRYEKHPTSTSGQLIVRERGLYGSEPQDHFIDPMDNFWSFATTRGRARTRYNGNNPYGRFRMRDSYLQLHAMENSAHTISHFIGGTENDQYAMYGCEMYFPLSYKWDGEPYYSANGHAGLVVHSDLFHNGYYFEITTTQQAIKYNPPLKEIRVLKRAADGSYIQFPLGNPGKSMDIVPGRRYRIEVLYTEVPVPGKPPGGHWSMFVNGQNVLNFEDLEGAGTQPNRGYWGVFSRWRTWARFENVWAFNRRNVNTDLPAVVSTVRDRVNGGFDSGTLQAQWRRYNRLFGDVVFEDFGPWVHEGREYDVQHDVYPSNMSELFVSDDDRLYTVYHDRDPYRSQFALVNASRAHAVVSGADPSRDDRNMSLFVYGRPIIEAEQQSVEVSDKLAIKRRGPEELDVESTWVQTKERARRIADWVITRWGTPNDIVEVDTILRPELQLGDLVAIDSAEEHMTPTTHLYNVVEIDVSVGGTTNMRLTLRRRR